jgi:hypothetical protein
MERLAETTPNCPREIIDEFNKKYKDEHLIALPTEVNGIHKIKIYRSNEHIKTPGMPASASELKITIPNE